MSKSLTVFSRIGRAGLGLMFALTIGLGVNTQAQAQAPGVGDGKWRTHICGNATASFVGLSGKQATSGIGGGDQAAQLIEAASDQTAGVVINFTYTSAVLDANDFRMITFNFTGAGDPGTKKNTTVHYCFQGDHGTGKIVTLETTLNKMTIGKAGNGFSQASQNAMQFGGLNVRNFVLRRVSISIASPTQPGNVTIGNLNLLVNSGTVNPAQINTNQGNCNGIFSCPPED